MFCNANRVFVTKWEIMPECLLTPGNCIECLLMLFYSGGIRKQHKHTKCYHRGSAGFALGSYLKHIKDNQSRSQTDGLDMSLFSKCPEIIIRGY